MTIQPVDGLWETLRRHTPARIGLGRVGDALSTREVLALESAHMAARDAVHTPLDLDAITARLTEGGFGVPAVVASRARDRAEYLTRPDLGRLPVSITDLRAGTCDVSIVLADGLSPAAVAAHGPALAVAIRDRLAGRYSMSAPVVATQARVALGDHVGQRLGASVVIVVIGERPGLSVSDSLGVYLTFGPHPGRRDSERNCVSNVHPQGMPVEAAADVTADLVKQAFELQTSGVRLKNTFGAAPEAVDSVDRGVL
jgi:ethanolamine ammonia-lyase small subunit